MTVKGSAEIAIRFKDRVVDKLIASLILEVEWVDVVGINIRYRSGTAEMTLCELPIATFNIFPVNHSENRASSALAHWPEFRGVR